MMKRIGTATVLALAACGTNTPVDPGPQLEQAKSALLREEHPSVPAADQAQFVGDNAAFAVDMYKGLVAGSKSNTWFSPHSITSALAMTYAGASGTTATEMEKALHYTLPGARLHAAFNWLDLELTKRSAAGKDQGGQPLKLRAVNTLFAERTTTWKAPFLDTLAVNYGAGVNLMNFAGAAEPSRKSINEWVSYQTEKKIDELLPSGAVSSDTRLVLVNAVYFNASWKTLFDAAKTTNDDFTPLGAEVPTKVATMHGDVEGTYGATDTAEIVEVPYSGDQTSMVVIVPKAGSFSTWESQLTGATLTTTLAAQKSANITLSLPKFHIKGATISLSKQLQALGMKDAFTERADFTTMTDTKLAVSDVLHQAFVDVNEKGTEAAAATAVITNDTAAVVDNHTLKVDRPFFVAIRDRVTGGILFAGRIVNPVE